MKGLMIASLFGLVLNASADRVFAGSIDKTSPTNPTPGLPCTEQIQIL